MIVLKTKGCEYARQTGGCTVCGFINNAVDDIRGAQIVEQLDYGLEQTDLSGVEELDLLTLGSFFNDNEVCPGTRRELLAKIAAVETIEKVSFESRAEYVSLEKLKESAALLEGKTVEFGIGLESADDHVRNEIIKKGLSKMSFENVVKLLAQAGLNLLVYLLIKPPYLSESRAIEDAVASARYVFETAGKYNVRARAAFEPVFICRNTPLEKLFKKTEYRIVNLWSVIEVIRQVHGLGTVFIGLSDEDLSLDRLPRSCPKCSGSLVRAIESFNRTRDIAVTEHLDCDCKRVYMRQLERGAI
jgi:radical SAM enzyme (TIGR01210 family)